MLKVQAKCQNNFSFYVKGASKVPKQLLKVETSPPRVHHIEEYGIERL